MSVFVVEASDQVDTRRGQSREHPAKRANDGAEDAPGNRVPGRLPYPSILGIAS